MSQPNADLQYACIFDLVTSKKCTEAGDCDCFGANLDQMANPLCQNAQGAYTNEQLRGKAYPGTRILQVLRGIGDRAIVASVCPAQTNDNARADFGYRPVVDALHTRFREQFGHLSMPCTSSSSPVDATTQQLPCAMVEVDDASPCGCDTSRGRRVAREELLTPEMKAAGTCRCEIKQLSGADQSNCRVGAPNGGGADAAGWCYVDPAQFGGAAACNAAAACPAGRKNTIRFNTPSSEPQITATTFLRCGGGESFSLPSVCP
jgi:hypothetical protein